MEGLLAKKTKGGKWKERFFKVADGKLSWFKSDNKTILSVDLVSNSDQGKSNNPPSTVRDVKFGVRKVSAGGRVLQLAASGEAEKQQWLNALEKAMGIESKVSAGSSKQLNQPKKMDTNKVAGIASALGLLGTPGSDNNAEAAERLRQKLAGTAIPMFGFAPKPAESSTSLRSNEESASNSRTELGSAESSTSSDNVNTTSNSQPQNEEAPIPGKLDNSAALSRPAIRGRRQAPQQLASVAKMTPPVEIKDKIAHENSFRLEIGDGVALVAHASSGIEKQKWTQCLANTIQWMKLKHDLETAQRVDMKSAIQAQINLESYVAAFQMSYTGYMEKLSVKSQRNWKKRYFELKDGKLKYFADENSKKEIFFFELSRFSTIKDHEGRKIEAQAIAELAEKKVGDDTVRNASSPSSKDRSDLALDSKPVHSIPVVPALETSPVKLSQQSLPLSPVRAQPVFSPQSMAVASPKPKPATPIKDEQVASPTPKPISPSVAKQVTPTKEEQVASPKPKITPPPASKSVSPAKEEIALSPKQMPVTPPTIKEASPAKIEQALSPKPTSPAKSQPNLSPQAVASVSPNAKPATPIAAEVSSPVKSQPPLSPEALPVVSPRPKPTPPPATKQSTPIKDEHIASPKPISPPVTQQTTPVKDETTMSQKSKPTTPLAIDISSPVKTPLSGTMLTSPPLSPKDQPTSPSVSSPSVLSQSKYKSDKEKSSRKSLRSPVQDENESSNNKTQNLVKSPIITTKSLSSSLKSVNQTLEQEKKKLDSSYKSITTPEKRKEIEEHVLDFEPIQMNFVSTTAHDSFKKTMKLSPEKMFEENEVLLPNKESSTFKRALPEPPKEQYFVQDETEFEIDASLVADVTINESYFSSPGKIQGASSRASPLGKIFSNKREFAATPVSVVTVCQDVGVASPKDSQYYSSAYDTNEVYIDAVQPMNEPILNQKKKKRQSIMKKMGRCVIS